MKALQVTKSNHLVEASYSLSLQEQRLLLACLAKIDPRKDPQKTMIITASEFSQMMGIDMSHAHRELYKAADKIYNQSITIDNSEQAEEFRWVQHKIKSHKGEGKITITWSDPVLKYISQLKARFTTYKLHHITQLQSPYSIRLYELLMQFNSTKERVINVDDFRNILKLEEKYAQFKILNRDVIKPAVKELNQRSDLVITYETIKQGRNVVALAFEFKQNAQLKLDL